MLIYLPPPLCVLSDSNTALLRVTWMSCRLKSYGHIGPQLRRCSREHLINLRDGIKLSGVTMITTIPVIPKMNQLITSAS